MTGHREEELDGLLQKFVCVRLIQMGGVDLSVFQFDPFLSWSVFLMNGDKTIYGRLGTASPNQHQSMSSALGDDPGESGGA